MNKKTAIEIAAKYFPTYPSVNTFHVTNDGQVFEEAGQAQNHANTAFKKEEEQAVFVVTREEAQEYMPGDTAADDAAKAKEEAINTAKENVISLQKTVDKKQKAFDKAGDDKKEDAGKELEAAKVALATAEAELNNLLEPAE